MNTRLRTADLLKGIAVILMVQVHILELFATPDIAASNWGNFLLFLGGPPVAPVFAVALGFFAAQSGDNSTKLIVRGFKLFLLGMLLNLLMNIDLMISVKRGWLHVDLMPYLLGVDILHLAGLSLIIIGLFRKPLLENMGAQLFLIAIVLLASPLIKSHKVSNLSPYISAFLYGSARWSYFPLLPWLAYPLLGLLCSRIMKILPLEKLKNNITRIILGILFLTFMVLTFRFAFDVSSNLQSYYHHGPAFFLWTVVFLFFYAFIMNGVELRWKDTYAIRYIEWLGRNVTLIYFLQWIIIGNIATEIYRTMSSPVQLTLSFVGVLLAVSIASGLLLRATNILKGSSKAS